MNLRALAESHTLLSPGADRIVARNRRAGGAEARVGYGKQFRAGLPSGCGAPGLTADHLDVAIVRR